MLNDHNKGLALPFVLTLLFRDTLSLTPTTLSLAFQLRKRVSTL